MGEILIDFIPVKPSKYLEVPAFEKMQHKKPSPPIYLAANSPKQGD
jgi:hypothetical protein